MMGMATPSDRGICITATERMNHGSGMEHGNRRQARALISTINAIASSTAKPRHDEPMFATLTARGQYERWRDFR